MGALKPDLYIAAIGRSGSTMLCNMLTSEPAQIIFIEPKFHTPPYRTLLAPQLAQYGMEISEQQQKQAHGLAPLAMVDHLLGAHLRQIKWGFKEVQCSEHQKVLDLFAPAHILINTRHIFNVALSFLEKHRRQGNEARFPPAWVRDYCERETQGLVRFCQHLTHIKHPHSIVRYEDFAGDADYLTTLGKPLNWALSTKPSRFFQGLNRGFETSRHQGRIFREPTLAERGLPDDLVKLAQDIEARCTVYQQFFGYTSLGGASDF